jgi:hypothetical protein
VILRLSGKALLITAACVVCAVKLHSKGVLTPATATQELNRCMSVVRAAATRKRTGRVPVERRGSDTATAESHPSRLTDSAA